MIIIKNDKVLPTLMPLSHLFKVLDNLPHPLPTEVTVQFLNENLPYIEQKYEAKIVPKWYGILITVKKLTL